MDNIGFLLKKNTRGGHQLVILFHLLGRKVCYNPPHETDTHLPNPNWSPTRAIHTDTYFNLTAS
jgi:hypothetical protein